MTGIHHLIQFAIWKRTIFGYNPCGLIHDLTTSLKYGGTIESGYGCLGQLQCRKTAMDLLESELIVWRPTKMRHLFWNGWGEYLVLHESKLCCICRSQNSSWLLEKGNLEGMSFLSESVSHKDSCALMDESFFWLYGWYARLWWDETVATVITFPYVKSLVLLFPGFC